MQDAYVKQSDNPYQQQPSPYIPSNQYNPPEGPGQYNPSNKPIERNSSYGADLNRLRPKESSMHCQALWATIFLLVGVFCGVYFYIKGDLSVGGAVGVCVGSYALYLIVGCCCNALTKYLENIDRGQNFERFYDNSRALIGRFTFHAECYHYQTRYHTRTVTDSNGNTRTQHYTTTQKVVTHTATQYLTPRQTTDESGSVDRIRAATNIVFIHFLVKYRFYDSQSSMNLQYAYSSFKMRNTRDVHQNFSMGYSVPGLIQRKAFYVGELGCDYATGFYAFSAFGFIWPYSLWMESKINRFEIDFMKVLKI